MTSSLPSWTYPDAATQLGTWICLPLPVEHKLHWGRT
jgi:hypothetical protein